jgi:hypothetical protein
MDSVYIRKYRKYLFWVIFDRDENRQQRATIAGLLPRHRCAVRPAARAGGTMDGIGGTAGAGAPACGASGGAGGPAFGGAALASG